MENWTLEDSKLDNQTLDNSKLDAAKPSNQKLENCPTENTMKALGTEQQDTKKNKRVWGSKSPASLRSGRLGGPRIYILEYRDKYSV